MSKKEKKTTKVSASRSYTRDIVPKSLSRVKSDVLTWKNAIAMAGNVDNPKLYPYHNLLADIMLDAHLTSQLQNRKLKTFSADFVIKKNNGEIHEDYTRTLRNAGWINRIVEQIIDSQFMGYSVIEFSRKENEEVLQGAFPTPIVSLIPRQNILPKKGILLRDYSDDKGVEFRNVPEYGVWLLDFGTPDDLGLLNKAVPHVLFSRFAQSCWSELCEIYGIPPRVMKTNTRDTGALRRAEKMMTDMGAAAWFIIDDTESFEWAQSGVPATGQVYDGLVKLCRDNISMLISGAILGQDTMYGSKGKEISSQEILQDLVNADQTLVEQYMNDKVFPALYAIGVLPESGLVFQYEQVEDVSELWTRTKEILPYKNVDDQWLIDKFGIQVTGDRTVSAGNELHFAAANSFFD